MLQKKKPRKLILTGGGTGGHVAPQLALIEYLEQHPSRFSLTKDDLLYLGSAFGIEAQRMSENNVAFVHIPSEKLRRYFSWRTLIAPFVIAVGCVRAWWVLRMVAPVAVFSSGGYVSLPVVFAAKVLGLRVIVHEQTTQFGLANVLASRVAEAILLSYPNPLLQERDKRYQLVGNPVRNSLLQGSKQSGLAFLGFETSVPVLLVLGGAQGAHVLNTFILQYIEELLLHCQIVIVTGGKIDNADKEFGNAVQEQDYEALVSRISQLPRPSQKRVRVFRHITTPLADVYACTDVIVSRSGAGTVAEIVALQIPSILVPLPQSANNEQLSNARWVQKLGGAVVMEQHVLENPQEHRQVIQELFDILADNTRRKQMVFLMKQHVSSDIVEQILQICVGNKT